MTSDRLARGYLARCRLRRRALDTLMQDGGYADVVREAHEVVELILKGSLRYVGLDPPKRHDVRKAVANALTRFPPEWQAELAQLAEQSASLAQQRGPAFYGDEDALVDASELFTADDAQAALTLVDRLMAFFGSLLGESR